MSTRDSTVIARMLALTTIHVEQQLAILHHTDCVSREPEDVERVPSCTVALLSPWTLDTGQSLEGLLSLMSHLAALLGDVGGPAGVTVHPGGMIRCTDEIAVLCHELFQLCCPIDLQNGTIEWPLLSEQAIECLREAPYAQQCGHVSGRGIPSLEWHRAPPYLFAFDPWGIRPSHFLDTVLYQAAMFVHVRSGSRPILRSRSIQTQSRRRSTAFVPLLSVFSPESTFFGNALLLRTRLCSHRVPRELQTRGQVSGGNRGQLLRWQSLLLSVDRIATITEIEEVVKYVSIEIGLHFSLTLAEEFMNTLCDGAGDAS